VRAGSRRPDPVAVDAQGVLGSRLLASLRQVEPQFARAAAFTGLPPRGVVVLLPQEDADEFRAIGSRRPIVLRRTSLLRFVPPEFRERSLPHGRPLGRRGRALVKPPEPY